MSTTSGAACDFVCNVWEALNSNFAAASLSALFGALLGAVGAHFIAQRSERKKQLVDEIRATNAATLLAFTIFSICASLKKQHVRDLKRTYDARRQEVLDHHTAMKEGRIAQGQEIRIATDFQHLSTPFVPVDVLRGLVFEKLSITRRPIILVAMLGQTLEALRSSIEQRNAVIDECRQGSVPAELIPHVYFGLPMNGGHVDARYGDCVGGIASYTDDCIMFSYLLCQDLERHAGALASSLGKKAPKIDKIDFALAKDAELIPAESLYADWVKMVSTSAKGSK